MKTIEQQVQLMALLWPDFRTTHRGEASVRWCGELAALERIYQISIYYALPVLGVSEAIQFPYVRVLQPRLIPNPRAAEEAPLPHVYFDDDDVTQSILCLFDPAEKEWTHDDFIALTTVKWTADWLACYEGWRASGRWHGGGRHQGQSLQVAG